MSSAERRAARVTARVGPWLRRSGALGAAIVIAAGLTFSPAVARPAAAATGRLLVSSSATYTVDPPAGAVHVSVAATLTNDQPSDTDFSYFWRELSWVVQPEASNVRVRDPAGDLAVSPTAADGYIDATFSLRRDLLYGDSIDLTISWDLAGGAARSTSTIRVGAAFVAFDMWAWGDSGTSSVTAILPAGFDPQTYGSSVTTSTRPDRVTIAAASIRDPLRFWVAVTATRDRSFSTETLNPSPDISLLVKGWPEDALWRTTVLDTLNRGLPELQRLIGLPWPVKIPVKVTEVYSPLLEGYAGIYYTTEDRIDISEDLDDLVIVHELSHAWFNDGLFTDRWIDEGLADTYAGISLVAMGEARQAPDPPSAADKGRIDLVDWGPPQRITAETVAREAYAYNASWFVVNSLYQEIGTSGMQAVFRAAHDNVTDYPGVGPAEPVAEADDWRRFLDLLQDVGGSTKAESLFREYVADQAARRELDARDVAREAYAALVDEGDGWLPPYYVRGQMGSWSFSTARTRIEEARAILDSRDRVDEAAAGLGLEADGALRDAYESASDNFVEADRIAAAETTTLADLASADSAIHADPDLLTTIGLLGETPQAGYDEAAAAFETGDLDAADATAKATLALVGDGARVGKERLLAIVGGAFGVTLLLAAALLLFRRGRRRRADAVAAGTGTAPSGPYGTLAADSPVARPPDADRDASPEGGSSDGEGSSGAS